MLERNKYQKIVYVVPNYPHIGGVSTVVQNLAENLAKMGKDVEVVSSETSTSIRDEYINGVYIKRFKLNYLNIPTIEMIRYIRTIRNSLVHLHGYHDIINMFVIPVIHNSNIIIFNTYYHGKSGITYRNTLLNIYSQLFRLIFRKIDAVICVSEYERKLVEAKSWNIKKIFFIPVGCKMQEIIKFRWDPDDDGFKKLLYVGRIVRHKNVHELVKSLIYIDNVKLTIVGTGPDEDKIAQLIEKYGLNKLVEWKRDLTYEELLMEYCKADVFVFPSKYESFGIVVCEAALIGCPTIVANSYALTEFVKIGIAKPVPMPIDCKELAKIINNLSAESPRSVAISYFKDWHEVSKSYIEAYELVASGRI